MSMSAPFTPKSRNNKQNNSTTKPIPKSPYRRTNVTPNKTATPQKSTPNRTPKKTPTKQDKQIAEIKQKYMSYNVEELRKAKSECIESMKFSETEAIEQLIQSKTKDNIDDIATKEAEWVREIIEDRVDNYKSELSVIAKRFEKEELVIRETEAKCLESIKKRHIAEIVEVETGREVILASDRNANCSDANNLRNAAKRLAAANDFEGARATAKESERVRKNFVNKKIEKTNEKFDRELQSLLNQQENQLRIIQERLQNSLETLSSGRASLEEELKRRFIVCVKARVQQALAEGSNVVGVASRKAEFSQSLSAKISKAIKEIGKEKGIDLAFLCV